MVMKTVLNVKMDSELKTELQKTAEDIGLPVSLILTNLTRQFINEKRITFGVQYIPNKKTAKILREIDRDIKLGRNISGPFNTGKEATDYLRSL